MFRWEGRRETREDRQMGEEQTVQKRWIPACGFHFIKILAARSWSEAKVERIIL